ncbi:MAG: RNA methyltransferase [Hyphomicrobiales bacterium]|nr:RNA methyltransferase [Hyphomicrobiales bacterium]MCP5373431.1 RNA methyltransferase [Hyphomicrobiales bacterium]
MAGTDSSKRAAGGTPGAPVVVLVDPQLGENIGMVARAMLNCGLADLRLVRPRDGWPNEKATAAASGAVAVIDGATLFETTEEAIADLHRVYATTARSRDMTKAVATPRGAAAEMRALAAAGVRVGVLFGRESKGLTNDDVALADTILQVPLNPAFSSLNLAQAVFCMGYEWFQAGDGTEAETVTLPKETRPATRDELLGFFEHLEQELDACGFLHVVEKRPAMVRNLRNLFHRAALTEQEVRTLRGVVSGLTRHRSGGEGEI